MASLTHNNTELSENTQIPSVSPPLPTVAKIDANDWRYEVLSNIPQKEYDEDNTIFVYLWISDDKDYYLVNTGTELQIQTLVYFGNTIRLIEAHKVKFDSEESGDNIHHHILNNDDALNDPDYYDSYDECDSIYESDEECCRRYISEDRTMTERECNPLYDSDEDRERCYSSDDSDDRRRIQRQMRENMNL
jgi:hypothetical protein